MHIHILGICGTFMGSLAVLAKELGYRVTGSDKNVYPPMSTQLEAQGIELWEGYDPAHLDPEPDMVIVGNAMSRGNPAVEYMLDKGMKYRSGPQWLNEYVLQDKWVLAVAGTHGKTTTVTMLAWVLEHAGMKPGFLIGGVPKNFAVSARTSDEPFFVIEADEYDTAFFDKRSKFVHYRPSTLVLNNLEYDHADIFPDLEAIKTQFKHVLRIVPSCGQVIVPQGEYELEKVIDAGCWTPVVRTGQAGSGAEFEARLLSEDGTEFEVLHEGEAQGTVRWQMTGAHSVSNALVTIAAARNVGVEPRHSIEALCEFGGVKRRMEELGTVNGVTVYDDFAHHPTAIETTLAGLRKRVGDAPVLAIIEPRSNTMKQGVHQATLADSARDADQVFWFQPDNIEWSLQDAVANSPVPAQVFTDTELIVQATVVAAQPGTHVVVMSNGGFEGIHGRLLSALDVAKA